MNTKNGHLNIHKFGVIDVINSSDFLWDINFYSPQNTRREMHLKNMTIHKGIDHNLLKEIKWPSRKAYRINSKSIGIIKGTICT